MYSEWEAGESTGWKDGWMGGWQPGQKSPEALCVRACVFMHMYLKLAFLPASIFVFCDGVCAARIFVRVCVCLPHSMCLHVCISSLP